MSILTTIIQNGWIIFMYFNLRPFLLEIPHIERGDEKMISIHSRKWLNLPVGLSLAVAVNADDKVNIRLALVKSLYAIKVNNP